MARAVELTLLEIRSLDMLGRQDTVIHRVDARAKLLATAVFIVAVMSLGKYDISPLAPFFIYPAVMTALGNLPVGSLCRKMLFAMPFALLVGMFNPLLDRQTLVTIGGVAISGGWVSFVSIMIRFVLTVGAALILISVTGMHALCSALTQLGVPKVFSMQVLFLYRYLFVLTEEGARMIRARDLRSFSKNRSGLKTFGHVAGSFLLRTMARAERIHRAMIARGFDGEVHTGGRRRLGFGDIMFVLGWGAFFIAARVYNLPHFLGAWVMKAAG